MSLLTLFSLLIIRCPSIFNSRFKSQLNYMLKFQIRGQSEKIEQCLAKVITVVYLLMFRLALANHILYWVMGQSRHYSMVCDNIFDKISKDPDPTHNYEVKVSMMEIYNENLTYLLAVQKKQHQQLKICESKQLGVYVQGLVKHPVHSYKQIDQKIQEGSKNRSIAATVMNAISYDSIYYPDHNYISEGQTLQILKNNSKRNKVKITIHVFNREQRRSYFWTVDVFKNRYQLAFSLFQVYIRNHKDPQKQIIRSLLVFSFPQKQQIIHSYRFNYCSIFRPSAINQDNTNCLEDQNDNLTSRESRGTIESHSKRQFLSGQSYCYRKLKLKLSHPKTSMVGSGFTTKKVYQIKQKDILKLDQQKIRVRQIAHADSNPSILNEGTKLNKLVYQNLTYQSRVFLTIFKSRSFIRAIAFKIITQDKILQIEFVNHANATQKSNEEKPPCLSLVIYISSETAKH